MGNRFDGKVAVVTGAGRGIGRGIAMLLAEEGASVVVNDLGCDIDGTGSSPEPADEAVEEIRSRGGRAVASYDNVALMESSDNVIKTAVDTYGRLDVLVNNVAVMRDSAFVEMTPVEFHQVISNNVKGTFAPTKYAAVQFRQQQSGHIINMTSDAGLGGDGSANYAAASEAIIGLTRTVARDLGRYGITCNAIAPVAKTRLFHRARETRTVGQEFSNTVPSVPRPIHIQDVDDWRGPGGPDDPENVAPLALLLCTDEVPEANGYVFGVREGSIFIYSNPSIERSVHKWGTFTMDEMDALVPKTIGAPSSIGQSPS